MFTSSAKSHSDPALALAITTNLDTPYFMWSEEFTLTVKDCPSDKSIDGMHKAPSTTIFDVKHWKSARMYGL